MIASPHRPTRCTERRDGNCVARLTRLVLGGSWLKRAHYAARLCSTLAAALWCAHREHVARTGTCLRPSFPDPLARGSWALLVDDVSRVTIAARRGGELRIRSSAARRAGLLHSPGVGSRIRASAQSASPRRKSNACAWVCLSCSAQQDELGGTGPEVDHRRALGETEGVCAWSGGNRDRRGWDVVWRRRRGYAATRGILPRWACRALRPTLRTHSRRGGRAVPCRAAE